MNDEWLMMLLYSLDLCSELNCWWKLGAARSAVEMVLFPLICGVATRAALPQTIARLEPFIPNLGLGTALPLLGGVLASAFDRNAAQRGLTVVLGSRLKKRKSVTSSNRDTPVTISELGKPSNCWRNDATNPFKYHQMFCAIACWDIFGPFCSLFFGSKSGLPPLGQQKYGSTWINTFVTFVTAKILQKKKRLQIPIFRALAFEKAWGNATAILSAGISLHIAAVTFHALAGLIGGSSGGTIGDFKDVSMRQIYHDMIILRKITAYDFCEGSVLLVYVLSLKVSRKLWPTCDS